MCGMRPSENRARSVLRTALTGLTTLTALLAIVGASVCAQDFEPRRWTHMPVGTNVLGLGYAYTTGDIDFNPTLKLEDAEVELNTAVAGFARYFPLFGTTARLDVQLPFQCGEWDGKLDGEHRSTSRAGMADPLLRFSVIFAGAPALKPKEFMEFREENPSRTAFGAALEVQLPLGEYKRSKLINLGENRFTIAPQIGVLHTEGRWSFELTASTFFHTNNDDFLGDNRLEQDPLMAAQLHVVKAFEWGPWVSGGVAYGWFGESSVNGDRLGDDRSKLLYGGAIGCPISRTQSLRVGYIRGDTLTSTGSDTHTFFMSWAIRF